ncbi:uncharacterized protein LOC133799885 [Humulus lupulus]|uniref:uncharacterized protein LOC133799885 n=1 Tax=Humulus lupulus TaxID=3486 RepID=UPI002B40AA11|nr:uncharacterized protein LOC133799885 [Humulus lupulus]
MIPSIYENPYSLSHADQPGAVLVSSIINGSCKYSSWVRSITISLVAKNKMGFVLDTFPTPPINDPNYNSWTCCNSMVMGWIINLVSPPIAASILYCGRASAMWQVLHDRYYQRNGHRIYQLKQSISNIKHGDLDITTYFTNLQTLYDELSMFRPLTDGASSSYQEQDYVLYFLMGSNESYAQNRTNIMMFEPLPPINKVFSLIIQEEKQIPLSNLQLPMAAPVHTNKPFGKKTLLCAHCGWKPKPRDPNASWTTNKQDFPSKSQPKQGVVVVVSNESSSSSFTAEQCQQLLTYLATQMQSRHVDASASQISGITSNSSCLIDTGASHHICKDKFLFTDFDDTVFPIFVSMPNAMIAHDKHCHTLIGRAKCIGNL